MSESQTPRMPQSQHAFERELLDGADEITRKTNEAGAGLGQCMAYHFWIGEALTCKEPATVRIDGKNFCGECADEFAKQRLHETKDEQDDGPWGLMPLAILLGLVGMAFIAIVVLKFCRVL